MGERPKFAPGRERQCAEDSPLEEAGFEPLGPPQDTRRFRDWRFRLCGTSRSAEETDSFARGTGGSNSLPPPERPSHQGSPVPIGTGVSLQSPPKSKLVTVDRERES